MAHIKIQQFTHLFLEGVGCLVGLVFCLLQILDLLPILGVVLCEVSDFFPLLGQVCLLLLQLNALRLLPMWFTKGR